MEQRTPGRARSNKQQRGAPGSAKEPQGTPTSGQLPFFNHTKKPPADEKIYAITLVLQHQTHLGIEKHPIKLITLELPHQTHLGAKNASFLPKKTPDQINYP